MINKETYLAKSSANRLAVRKAINKGLALPIVYGKNLLLLAAIHAQIDPLLEARRKAEDFLSGTGRNENQGFTFDLEKYSGGHEYAMGRQTEPDLASENEPRFAMIEASAKLAENKGIEPSSPDFENSEVAFLSRD